MGVKWKTKTDKTKKIQSNIEVLNGKTVNVGVMGGGQNAMLASIHEYGCIINVTPKMRAYLRSIGLPLKSSTTKIVIPERSFLRNGYDEKKHKVFSDTTVVLKDLLGGDMAVNAFLQFVGIELSSQIKDYARDLSSPANSKFTISRKGSSNPLIDTGGMISAISWKVE